MIGSNLKGIILLSRCSIKSNKCVNRNLVSINNYLSLKIREYHQSFYVEDRAKDKFKRPLRGGTSKTSVKSAEIVIPPGPATDVTDPWVEVVDKPSGKIYYWNTQTNETTALDAPKPTSLSNQQQQPQSESLGSVMAQGFAFGIGSSVAHSMVGSFFGGGGGHDSSPDIGGGDSFFDV